MKRTLFVLLSSSIALSNIYAADKEDAINRHTINKQADQTLYPAKPEFFRGKVTPRLLFDGNEYITGAALVRFEKGARIAWHNHPAGQNLIVTGGTIYTGTARAFTNTANTLP
ncbi:hypothetical protein [Neisseria musculi]|uniref:Cupin domain protein n=1 Tax=Neisseria musculi TaxID=1815583 RepID=A0A7H1MBI5_9NEIS|nr:hypothetical protein [Neisseria musculi]QNT59000.1 hypothetical protein H7A79_0462 [Neisseria musculi]